MLEICIETCIEICIEICIDIKTQTYSLTGTQITQIICVGFNVVHINVVLNILP